MKISKIKGFSINVQDLLCDIVEEDKCMYIVTHGDNTICGFMSVIIRTGFSINIGSDEIVLSKQQYDPLLRGLLIVQTLIPGVEELTAVLMNTTDSTVRLLEKTPLLQLISNKMTSSK